MIEFLKDQFSEEEIQEVADFVADKIGEADEAGKRGIELRWSAESAVKEAFGAEDE